MAKSSSNLEPFPNWAKQALQGVTYWMGHRRCLYSKYPLAEGALVAEVCNLIHAHLPDRFTLTCEVQYSKLLPEAHETGADGPEDEILTQKARADLVVSEGPLDFDSGQLHPKFFIEVKRANAPKSQIDSDLRRLAEVRRKYPAARAFLFVISEANRPRRFVNEEGSSRKGEHAIPDMKLSKGWFRVRRTWKAAHAFKTRDKAQYACLIEVYAKKQDSVQ